MIIVIFEGYNCMLRGVIKAMNLQFLCAVINVTGHWIINLSLMIYFGFYLKFRIFGLWMAKFVLELFILASYTTLIYIQDWKKIEI